MSTDSARPALHLPARYLAIVQDILRRYLPLAEVWAYGSRVKGDHHDASDLDLVARQPDDLTRPQPDLDEVAAAFSDSDLPILVQIVDWARIPAAFREEIEAGYAVLQAADDASAASTDTHFLAPTLRRGSVVGPLQRPVSTHRIALPGRLDTGASPLAPTLERGSRKRAWRYCTLGHVIELKRGYDLPQSDRRPGSVPVVSSSGVSGWHDEAKVKAPGVVTGRYGTLGEVHYITKDYWPLNTTLYVRDFKGNDARFISYFLQSLDFQAANDKSSVPGLNRNDLHRYEVAVPPPFEQRAIAVVLGALDDKIEQNRRTAQALERLARAIFRAWFVDFEPVKAKAAGATAFPSMPQPVFDALSDRFVDSEIGPVPEGWDVWQHRVAELEAQGALSVGDGYRAKRSELADSGLPFIRAGNVNGNVNTEGAELLCEQSAAKAGPKRSRVWDTVFTSKGTVGRIGLITPWTGDVIYAPQVCYWRSLDERTIDPFFLHLWICSASFTNQWMAVKGNTDMADFVSLSDQRAMRLAVPPSSLQSALRSIVEPLFRLKAETDFESRKLAEMRDYLLPKLLSGALRVKDAATAAEGLA
jgi:type I restriction enzyme S subunit